MSSRLALTLATALLATALALVPDSACAAPSDPNPWDGLVEAATQRLLTADPVAVAKWHTRQSIDDPAREQQVLASVDEQARQLGADRSYTHRVFRDQLDATKAVEYARFAAWTRNPTSAPPARTSLTAVRTRIDSLNREMVRRIAADTAAAHSPGCPAAVAAAVTAATARHHLDPVAARALPNATRDYCD